MLFLTASEYGEANVVLAVAYELLLRQKYEVHIGSFSPLKSRIKELNSVAESVTSSQAVFHTVAGPSIDEILTAREDFFGPYPPGVQGAINSFKISIPVIATAWDGPGYMVGYKSCLEIISNVQPDLLVVGSLMNQGHDACQTLQKKYIILSPNTFREILGKQQPILSQLLTYPAIASAFPYPVPWHLIPANLYIKIRGLTILLTNAKIKELVAFRKSENLADLPPAFNIWKKEYHYLLPSIPETDFPCNLMPNVTPCGPLLLPFQPVAEGDPELEIWLRQGPTVLINLGSHITMDDAMAREFSAALKALLDIQPKVQVLWKLKKSGRLTLQTAREFKEKSAAEREADRVTAASLEAISSEIESGRVKVEEWLSVDPLAVLRSGHVVCAVHHGGSNSYHETLSAGIPQIVLPCWLDTFDFANRVEYLGIGVYGSRKAAPRVERTELSAAFTRVLGDGLEASRMRSKAKELGEIANKTGGRMRAAEKIEELLKTMRS